MQEQQQDQLAVDQKPGQDDDYETMLAKMELYREECVRDGRLLEAEEAQAQVEELKDQAYNERRSALLA